MVNANDYETFHDYAKALGYDDKELIKGLLLFSGALAFLNKSGVPVEDVLEILR
jgi:hypothetical protein